MSAVLADMGPGFRDQVHGSQQVFRTLLAAMAHPGRRIVTHDLGVARLLAHRTLVMRDGPSSSRA